MTRHDITIDGRNVRYYEGGAGDALLLVHGAGATARFWHYQFEAFARHFRVLAPDLSGFGGSERSPNIQSVRDYARFLSEFLSTVNVPIASVLGSSMGGWAGAWLAADFPEKVDKLLLVSPAGAHRADEPPMAVDEVLRTIEDYYKSITGAVGMKPSDEMLKALETIRVIDRAGGFVPDIEPHLHRINVPTLVIWGENDRVIPPSYARIFAAAIPGAQARILHGAGHIPYVETPEEFNRTALEFLRRT